MKTKFIITIFLSFLLSTFAHARDQIRIVGSSTVYPFTTVVGEAFGKSTDFETPVIESTGTGGGFKLFCKGIGSKYPDFNNASRAIKKSEIEKCKNNGITIIEIKIGYDGIVFANSKSTSQVKFTRKEIYLALAKVILINGKLVKNPYKKWSDINSFLPNTKIEVLGPPPTSGTRDAFVELVMESGAKTFPELKSLRKTDKKKFKAISHGIREDGAYIEAGENDNLIIQKIGANPNAFGIFGFSFLDSNMDKIQGSIIEGVEPNFETIADGSYKVSRPLFMYAKNEHIKSVHGMKQFIEFYTSNIMMGNEGVLADKGLIPLPIREYKALIAKLN
jgi:phosphate transport system substrate-binding protein